jgi:hypothetical protein
VTDTIKGITTDTHTVVHSNPVTVTVDVPCALEVEKTAFRSFNRLYTWTIQKYSDLTNNSVTVPLGTQTLLPYSFVLSNSSNVTSTTIFGEVEVHNPNNVSVKICKIADVFDGGVPVDLDCPGVRVSQRRGFPRER